MLILDPVCSKVKVSFDHIENCEMKHVFAFKISLVQRLNSHCLSQFGLLPGLTVDLTR